MNEELINMQPRFHDITVEPTAASWELTLTPKAQNYQVYTTSDSYVKYIPDFSIGEIVSFETKVKTGDFTTQCFGIGRVTEDGFVKFAIENDVITINGIEPLLSHHAEITNDQPFYEGKVSEKDYRITVNGNIDPIMHMLSYARKVFEQMDEDVSLYECVKNEHIFHQNDFSLTANMGVARYIVGFNRPAPFYYISAGETAFDIFAKLYEIGDTLKLNYAGMGI